MAIRAYYQALLSSPPPTWPFPPGRFHRAAAASTRRSHQATPHQATPLSAASSPDPLSSLDPLSQFGFLLKDVSRLYSRNAEHHVAGLGLTIAQCRVLGYLQREEGISQSRLADLVDADPMTLGRQVARMVDEGLIERRPNPEDGRAHSLFLRRKATLLLDRIWPHCERSRAEALAGLSPEERTQLMRLMERVQDNLEARLADPERVASAALNHRLESQP